MKAVRLSFNALIVRLSRDSLSAAHACARSLFQVLLGDALHSIMCGGCGDIADAPSVDEPPETSHQVDLDELRL